MTSAHSVGSAVSVFSAYFSSEHLADQIVPFNFPGGKKLNSSYSQNKTVIRQHFLCLLRQERKPFAISSPEFVLMELPRLQRGVRSRIHTELDIVSAMATLTC